MSEYVNDRKKDIQSIIEITEIPEQTLTTLGQGSFGTVSIYNKQPNIVIKEHTISLETDTIDIYKKRLKEELKKPEDEKDNDVIAELNKFIETANGTDFCKTFKEQEYDKQVIAFECFNTFLKSIDSKIPRPINFKYATRENRNIILTDKLDDKTKSCVIFMEKLNYPSITVLETIIKSEFLNYFKKTDETKIPAPYLFFSDINDHYEHGRIKLTQMKTSVFKHSDKDLFASITDENVTKLAKNMMSSFFGLTFNCELIVQDIEFLLTDKLHNRSRPCIGIIDYDQVQFFEKRTEMGNKLMKNEYNLNHDIAYIYMNLSGNSYGHLMQIDNKSVWKFLPDPNILPEIFLNHSLFMLSQTVSHSTHIKKIIPDEYISNYSEVLKTILNVQYNLKLEKCRSFLETLQTSQVDDIKKLLFSWHNDICIYGSEEGWGEDDIKRFESTLNKNNNNKITFERIQKIDLNKYRFFIKKDISVNFENDSNIYYLLQLDDINLLNFNLLDDIISLSLKTGVVYNFYNTSPELTILLFDILIQKIYLLIYFMKNYRLITKDVISDLTTNINKYSFEKLINYFDELSSLSHEKNEGGKKINKTKKYTNKKLKKLKTQKQRSKMSRKSLKKI